MPLKILAFTLGSLALSAQAKTYDWPLNENATLTINIAKGTLLINTRDDGKPQVSLDLQHMDMVRDSSLTTLKATNEIPSEEPQWSVSEQGTTLTLPSPAAIDLQQVKGITAALTLPATGHYVINGTLVNVQLTGTKSDIRVNVVNGKVTAQNAPTGNVAIDVLMGEIATQGMKGDLSLKLRSGSVADKGSQGNIDVELVNGDLTLDSLAKKMVIRQAIGKQTINAPACENFTNDLQTGTGVIRLGASLITGNIFTVDGELTTIIADDWQGTIVAEGKKSNGIINHLTEQRPVVVTPLLPDERLELTQGKTPAARLNLATVAGVFTLQHPEQAGK